MNAPAPIHREPCIYEADGQTFEAHVARLRDGAARRPAVVLGHDWSGIHDGMRRIADRIAALGYVAFVVDVYGQGVRGDPLGDNHALMDPLLADRGRLRKRLLAGLAAAARHPAVDPTRVATLGFCFGGLCALDLARAAPPGLRAAISVHGVLSPPRLLPQPPIDASILVLHGWEDPVAPPPDVLALALELTAAGADWQLHAHGHARHAFTFEGANLPERGIVYDARASKRAWAAIEAFLGETLGSDGG